MIYWLSLSLGMFSSLHCLLMCAPLQAVVMGHWLHGSKRWHWLIYHLGRIFTYALLGMLAGLLGSLLGLPRWQSEFALLAGIALLLAYLIFQFARGSSVLSGVWTMRFSQWAGRLRKKGGIMRFFLAGNLNGFLPCGMVYLALVPALTYAQPAGSALAMLLFGLGTLPVLLVVNLTAQGFLQRWSSQLPRLIPVGILLMSSLLILRGLELDIPYLSPASPQDIATAEGCR